MAGREKKLEDTDQFFNNVYPDRAYREKIKKQIFEDIQSGDPERMSWEGAPITTKNGKKRLVSAKNISLYEQNLMISTVQDITESVKLQAQLQQAQKMEAIGTLAGGISHDFNNILQAINGYTQLLLLDKDTRDPECPNLQAIEIACDRAAQLVRQLLLFSRKSVTDRKPLDLNQEVEQAQKLLERTIPKMIDIEAHIGSRLWSVVADPVQIEQIFLNLGSNAADAMPEGGKLVITTENVMLDDEFANTHLGASPGRYVLCTFTDTGCGMDEETIKHIFEPFFTTKEIGKGTGLGLASVYGIIKSHEGYISCQSEPGQGATFKIYLPATEQSDSDIEDGFEKVFPQQGAETILLVDDEEILRDMGSSALERFGYTVLTASSGEECLDVYTDKKNEIDLVIMDLGMPGMGGAKCLREIMRFDPTSKVVIASGYSANGLVKEALAAGAAGYIGKPYRLTELLKKVRTILDEM